MTIRVVVSDGDRYGQAVCECGCSFPWNQRANVNVLYQMQDGNLVVYICCPRCATTINGPVV
jgi:hypothetical protein